MLATARTSVLRDERTIEYNNILIDDETTRRIIIDFRSGSLSTNSKKVPPYSINKPEIILPRVIHNTDAATKTLESRIFCSVKVLPRFLWMLSEVPITAIFANISVRAIIVDKEPIKVEDTKCDRIIQKA